jgi:AcrR family transcriptional regulator
VATQSEPKRQERGRRRIELILDVAEEVIAEAGYDAATTNLLAARARMSPGSLYQYFANKAAIVEALTARFVADLSQTRDGLDASDLAGLPIGELVDRVVDPIVAFNVAHPAAKSLLATVDAASELAATGRGLHDAIAERIRSSIDVVGSQRRARDRELAVTVSLQILAGVLPAVVAASPRDRPRLVRELKAVLSGYWASLSPA